MEVCKKYNVNKIINLQTALCYGKTKNIPITIDHKINPTTSYSISKVAGELYLLNSNLPVVSLRLANICAPRLSIGPIPTFYKKLKLGQDCYCSDSKRDFLDISDFINLVNIILNDNSSSGFYNVSSGIGNSILEVYKQVANYLNIKLTNFNILPVNKDDVSEIILDPSKTKKTFNWEAKVSFEDMIKKQLVWYDENGVNQVFSHLKK